MTRTAISRDNSKSRSQASVVAAADENCAAALGMEIPVAATASGAGSVISVLSASKLKRLPMLQKSIVGLLKRELFTPAVLNKVYDELLRRSLAKRNCCARAVSYFRTVSSCSARSQSSMCEPCCWPRATQYEYASFSISSRSNSLIVFPSPALVVCVVVLMGSVRLPTDSTISE